MTSEATGVVFTFEGNTALTLVPNSTETVRTTDTGQGNVTFLPGGTVMIHAQSHMTTDDGSENATGHFTEFMKGETPTGIGVAYFNTNSTERLEPLDNKLAVLLDEIQPNEDSMIRFFEWKSGSSGGEAPSISNENSTSIIGGSGSAGSGGKGNTTTMTTTGTPVMTAP
jgi:hypothetical protein